MSRAKAFVLSFLVLAVVGALAVAMPATALAVALPPDGVMSINQGWDWTSNVAVTVDSTMTNAATMRIGETGVGWLSPIAYAAHVPFTVSAGEGRKEINVEYTGPGGIVNRVDSVWIDTTPPTAGMLTVNGGYFTNSTTITVTHSAVDASPVEAHVHQSAPTSGTWSTWAPAASAQLVTLTAGDDEKLLWAEYRDAAGNYGGGASGIVYLDQTPPNPYFAANSGERYIATTTVPVYTGSGGEPFAFHQRFTSDGGANWTGWTSVDNAYGTYASVTIWPGDRDVTITAQFRDDAGNLSTKDATVTLDTTPPSGWIRLLDGAPFTLGSAPVVDHEFIGGAWRMDHHNGTEWIGTQSFATTRAVWLEGADGTRTITARFWDEAYNSRDCTVSVVLVSPVGYLLDALGLSDWYAGSGGEWFPQTLYSAGDGHAAMTMPVGRAGGTRTLQLGHMGPGTLTYRARVQTSYGRLDVAGPLASETVPNGGGWTTHTVSLPFVPSVQQYVNFTYVDEGYSDPVPMAAAWLDGCVWAPIGPSGTASVAAGASLVGDPHVQVESHVESATVMETSVDGGATWVQQAFDWSPVLTLPGADGTKTVVLKYYNQSGAPSLLITRTIVLDTTAPSGTMTLSDGAAFTTSTAVTVCSAVTDLSHMDVEVDVGGGAGYSSPVSYLSRLGVTLPAGDGTKTVHARYADALGHQTVLGCDIFLDSRPPTTSCDATGSYATPAVITLTPTDPAPGSGVAGTRWSIDGGVSTSGTVATTSLSGVRTLTWSSVDAAGNRETTKTATFSVVGPPVTNHAIVPASPNGLAGWYVTTPTISVTRDVDGLTWYRADAGSWSPSSVTTLSLSPQQGTVTYEYYGVNSFDVTETPTHSFTIKLDSIAPITSSDATASYTTSAMITLTPTDPDPGSGLVGTRFSFDGGATWTTATVATTSFIGTSTLTWSSVDAAGNREATKTATFTVRSAVLATSITIKTNATTARIGNIPILSGAVTPVGMIGKNIVAYVMKPGKTYWTYSSNRTVYNLGGKAAWQYKYYFKPGMVKGYYKFKAVVPAWPGFLTSTSPTTVSIRLQ